MSSDSSALSRTEKKFTQSKTTPTIIKMHNSEEEDGRQTSRESRNTDNSAESLSQPRVTVLEQMNYRNSSSLHVYNRANEEPLKGTGTSQNSTSPTVITAVLKDLSDDIVHSPDYRHTAGPVALVNGERSIAVISGENIYVQNKTKFVSVPRDKVLSNHHDHSFWTYHTSRLQEHSPLDVALIVQKMFTPISTISFGLLGGVALLQLFVVHYLVGGSTEQDQSFFLQSYSKFAQLTPLLFYILLTVCTVSILDRIPVKQEVPVIQPTWLVVVLYVLTLILSLSCAPYDDMISLYHQNKTLFSDQMKTQGIVSDWKLLNAARCVLAILGWILFSLTNPTDLLLQHLHNIKQQEQENKSTTHSLSTTHA